MNTSPNLKQVSADTLPDKPDLSLIYVLERQTTSDIYQERTGRNIGWISEREQEALRAMRVGIAGCGGMGGKIAPELHRLGVGHLNLADIESFDISNMNRQFSARADTIGKSKAFETARDIRRISDDSELTIFAQGITKESVEQFVDGCDLIIDEIEFWNIGACILLHQAARRANVPILNGLTVGFSAFAFLFAPESAPVEQLLDVSLGEAYRLQDAITAKTASKEEIDHSMQKITNLFVPYVPSYFEGNDEIVLTRLREKQQASIIAPNPLFAAGFVADHALFCLLEKIDLQERTFQLIPTAPSYAFVQANPPICGGIVER